MKRIISKYRQIKNRFTRKWAIRLICVFLLLALLHPFIANERPLYCVLDGKTYFPVFRQIGSELGIVKPYQEIVNFDWRNKNYDRKWMPIIPYSYHTIDKRNSQYRSPFASQEVDNLWQRHWLGTDILGRDVFAGLLKGAEIAVRIGFLSVGLAGILALIIGFLAAYLKIFPMKVNGVEMLLLILGIMGLFYSFWIGWNGMKKQMLVLIFILFALTGLYAVVKKKVLSANLSKANFTFPSDGIYLRIVEAFKALPVLILILACISIFETITINGLILMLSLLMWPGLSRYVRAESLKILSQDYITAAQSYGATKFRILTRHVLPKLFASLSVILAFGISSAIIVEATLSFLGIGLPIEQVSWGSLLKEAKINFSAWWLAIFPGLALFMLILTLNVVGEDLEKTSN